jgi:hypothetical protein
MEPIKANQNNPNKIKQSNIIKQPTYHPIASQTNRKENQAHMQQNNTTYSQRSNQNQNTKYKTQTYITNITNQRSSNQSASKPLTKKNQHNQTSKL